MKLDDSDSMLTEKKANLHFASVFEALYNETFFYNPNMRQLMRKVKGLEKTDKPMMLILNRSTES